MFKGLMMIIQVGFYIALLLNSLIIIPQIVKLYRTQCAKNLSLTSFLGFFFIQLIMLLHGYLHHDLELTIGMVLSLLTTGALVIQIILYNYFLPFFKKTRN